MFYGLLILEGIKMDKKTITRADICEAIYHEVGLSRKDTTELLEMILDEISASLVRGETVKISSFGTFSVRDKKQRIGRNPKTGEEVPITPRRVLSFRPSQLLKKQVNP
jgi:integration host factor subunit alpha